MYNAKCRKSVPGAGGKDLNIQIGNLVLLQDHPECQNNIQGNYECQLSVMELKHQDPNVYSFWPLYGKGPMFTVNWWQSYDL